MLSQETTKYPCDICSYCYQYIMPVIELSYV
uniref:C2H2 type zinc-finger protein n=1 Tax=Siphoviridae sp. ctOVO10 TaxID=2826311 RepID=A0A8S5M3I5_9CAUD|nr:MAG TPA: C2H2 type zinc-finger protein [Siphoviridae sp. ctOVO10]DAP46491.1 MAG TPA: C2H2 type zinc-finger protein [Caudoviricetes sp.]